MSERAGRAQDHHERNAETTRERTRVGIIAWQSPEYQKGCWWQSTERAEDLITQSAGYLFELLISSGRPNNKPEKG